MANSNATDLVDALQAIHNLTDCPDGKPACMIVALDLIRFIAQEALAQ